MLCSMLVLTGGYSPPPKEDHSELMQEHPNTHNHNLMLKNTGNVD